MNHRDIQNIAVRIKRVRWIESQRYSEYSRRVKRVRWIESQRYSEYSGKDISRKVD